ncbi:hypothetical protein SDC9_145816 [bioreactor metagenome]|uniref:mRNA interferase toxin YafQ n=1 Tax=bioreactor metagenome TaxID=1076179 RepID=A0A645EBY8_9ZZZZ
MAKYKLLSSTQYKKDLKKVLNNPRSMMLISKTLKILEQDGVNGLPKSMLPHQLKGRYLDNWECHIRPDLLLMWFQYDEPTKTIKLLRIGSHSELFD